MKNINKCAVVAIATSIFMTFSSCDNMFNEKCVYKGFVKAENEFHHVKDIDTPARSDMNLIVIPLTGEGVIQYNDMSVPFNEKGIADETLYVGKYDFLAYNKGNNLLKTGKDIRDLILYQPTENGMITASQTPIYSSYIQGTVVNDDTLHLKMCSECLVQKLVFNVEIEDLPSNINIEKVIANLEGVTTSRRLYDKEKGSDYAKLPFDIDNKISNTSFKKEIYVFGMNTGVSNVINIVLSGDTSYKTSVDLSSVFQNAKSDIIEINIKIKFKGTLEGIEANLESWKDIDRGEITVTY